MAKARIPLIIFLLCLIAFMGTFLIKTAQKTSTNTYSQYGTLSKDYKKWADLIDKKGPDEAYKEFKDEVQKVPQYSARHAQAHIFGEVLFDTEGMDGIGICDDAFVYGCYHSFLGKAIEKYGAGIITTLDKKCAEKERREDPMCQHGIGHGIIGYLGYKEDDLLKALEFCKTVPLISPTTGCASGVFMEYNRRTMIDPSGSGQAVRPPGQDVYAPCSQVPKEFLPACYDEEPHWWTTVFNWDYKKVGKLCAGAPSEDLAETCVKSLSYSNALNSNYNLNKILYVCNQMPTPHLNIVCRAEVVNGFSKETLASLCTGLEAEQNKNCLSMITHE